MYLNSIRSTIRLTLTILGPDQNNSYLTSKTRLLQVPRSSWTKNGHEDILKTCDWSKVGVFGSNSRSSQDKDTVGSDKLANTIPAKKQDTW